MVEDKKENEQIKRELKETTKAIERGENPIKKVQPEEIKSPNKLQQQQ